MTDLSDDRLHITLVPDISGDNGYETFDCWLAALDVDDHPHTDAVGRTPELALAALAQRLASQLVDQTPQ